MASVWAWLRSIALTLLAGRVWAQLPGQTVATANQEWRVVNAAPTVLVWALVEVEFHIAPSCDNHVRGAPISSGEVIFSDFGQHPKQFAFDGSTDDSLERTWWPNCSSTNVTQGCAANTAWIGQNFDESDFDVLCVRIYQAHLPEHQASAVALERWTGSNWQRVRIFSQALGQYFMNFPTQAFAKWRLQPLDPMIDGWAVIEMSFSSDVDCTGNLNGVPTAYGHVGNGSANSDWLNPPHRLLDDDLSTIWWATCAGACVAGEPWLELLLAQPGQVRCIRLLQLQSHGAGSLQLQAWNGEHLSQVNNFLDLIPGSWDHLARWDVAGRPPGSLWRLVPNGTIGDEWAIAELELHWHANCSAQVLPISTISSGAELGNLSTSLTDQSLTSFWRAVAHSNTMRGSSWEGRYAGGNISTQYMGFPWAGVSTDPTDAKVRCIRLLQSGDPSKATDSLVLQRWGGSAWEDYTDNAYSFGQVDLWFTGLANEYGLPKAMTWQDLPALDRIQWRVAQMDILWMPWALKEMHFFQTISCTVEVTGHPISSGEDPDVLEHPSWQVFDGELSTEWRSPCTECREREAWIGLRLSAPRSIRCIQLFQSSLFPLWSTQLALQKWNGHRWATVEVFGSLNRGVWDHMHVYGHQRLWDDAPSGLAYWSTEAETLWRLSHADEMPLRWALARLGFYQDLDCRLLITDGRAIASGYVIDFEPEAASAGGVGTEWLSPCEGCAPHEAWLGLWLPFARRPRCVQLLQSLRPRLHTSKTAVEYWDGSAWRQEVLLEGLEAGAWRVRPLPQLGMASDTLVRWRVALRTLATDIYGPHTWRVGDLKFFSSGGCTNELHGFHIASGYRDGHGPELAFDDDPASFWESDCKGCGELQAWLGISVQALAPTVRCVQIRQAETLRHGAGRVSVQGLRAGSSDWEDAGEFGPLSFGAWDHLHMPAPMQLGPRQQAEAAPRDSLWRLATAAFVARRWAVQGVAFFATVRGAACAEQLIGTPIASGQTAGRPPSVAAGLNGTTNWQAPCLECNPGVAWLGVLLPEAAEVHCILLQQSELAPEYAPAVTLEHWTGTAWETVRRFDGLDGGSLQQLSAAWEQPQPLQRFRVANAAELSTGRWRVQEVAFFTSVDCALAVSGAAISSGFEGTSSPVLAFDGDVTTGWEAGGFPPMPAGTRWLGAHFTGPQDVKCALIMQGSGAGQWAPRLALESWDGSGWLRVTELDALGSGSWLALHTFASAWRPLHVNFQDRVTVPPQGWEVDIGLLFGPQPSGHSYGWSCELKGANRQRLNDVLLDTIVPLDGCASPVWDLKVPVGRYYARLLYSNPGVGGSSNGCRLEGRRAGGGPYGEKSHAEASITVEVTDSFLTFSRTATEACDAISAISVLSLPALETQWRVSNGGWVPGNWRVQELDLRLRANCGTAPEARARLGMLYSGYLPDSPPELAADGQVSTSWASACHGCSPGAAWLGMTYEVLQSVRCIRVYQSAEPTSQSASLVLERWNGTDWGAYQTFVDTPGGLWGEYNNHWVQPPSGHRWRLLAETGTVSGALGVAEAALYEDLACRRPLQGFAISNEVAPASPAALAFDSDLSTEWVSSCSPCNASEAWLGLHSLAATEVLCFTVVLGYGSRQLQDSSQNATSEEIIFRLESWNGSGWVATEATVAARAGLRVSIPRFGEVPGLQTGAVWRVVNLARTTLPWRLQELQFYATSDCQGLLGGAGLASSEDPTQPASLAFDGDPAWRSAWAAGCPDWGCAQESQWLGSLFERAEAPLCVRLYQSSETLLGNPAASVLRLERWTEEGWEIMRIFGALQPVVSGMWATLTVLSAAEKYRTAAAEWRLVADGALAKRWAVLEVAFFEDIECRDPLLGTPGASGEFGDRLVAAAFDGDEETAWWSQSSPQSREAWLGLAFGRHLIIRCVLLLQQADPGSYTETAQLQVRPEADWLHVHSFTQLALGEWQSLHVFQSVTDKPAGAMWRVANYDTVERGWVLVELEFYEDAECTRLEVGQAISSGYSRSQDPSQAFDLRLGSWWRAPCRQCSQGRAWLGQSFHRLDAAPGSSTAKAAQVLCVVLMQDDGANRSGSQTVVLERWDGEVFRRVGKFAGVPSGEFVQLRPGGSYLANDTVTVDWGRRQELIDAANAPSEPPGFRDQLFRTRDRVTALAAMTVDAWPQELLASAAHSADFQTTFAAALRTAAAARLRQPRSHVYADDLLMSGYAQQLGGQRASLTAALTVFVASTEDDVEGAMPWETNARAVLERVQGIAEDPYNSDSLLLTDRLKVELRRENRFSSLRAQVVAAVEPGLELRLNDVLLIPAVPLLPPTPAPPPPPPPPEPPADRTLLYILILASLVVVAVGLWLWRYRRIQRELLIQDMEVWEANYPGMPFPKQPPTRVRLWRAFKRCFCCCCSLWDNEMREYLEQRRGARAQRGPSKLPQLTLTADGDVLMKR